MGEHNRGGAETQGDDPHRIWRGLILGVSLLCTKSPIDWMVPTKILYGSRDNLTSLETISDFAEKHSATLTVMEGGEHWFHTEAQMRFLDDWILRERQK